MWGKFRILCLLLLKNVIVRKRHWIGSIFELVLPGCIVLLILGLRSLVDYDYETISVENATHYPVYTESYLISAISTYFTYLYYTPQNNFTNQLMKDVLQCAYLADDRLSGFDTVDELLLEYEASQNNGSWFDIYAFYFSNTDEESVPKQLTYTIRGRNIIPNILLQQYSGPSEYANWFVTTYPIAALQTCLDNAFIDQVASNATAKPTVSIQMMPYPPYSEGNISETFIQTTFSMLGGLVFLATMFLLTTSISAEKSSGVNALLKMNGIKPYQNFLSWLATGIFFGIIPVSSMTLMLKLNLFDQTAFYYHSNGFIIWLTLFITFIQIYAFCIHIASYFSKAWLAQIVAIAISVVMSSFVPQIENTSSFVAVPYLGFFFPTIATMRILDELNNREDDLTGAQWGNLFETANQGLDITGSLGFIMLFSILGIIFHFVLAVYFEAVLPSKYGVQKSPLFFLQCFKSNKVSSNYGTESSEGQPKILEPVTNGSLNPGIQLKNLTKSFTSGYFKAKTVNAVQGITLDFYKGQITALLGHNGAGKTTIFSIMTGLTSPSTGTVYINGKDVTKDLDEIRNDLSLCSQENILFSDLTVLEQLRLVGLLKQKDRTRKQVMRDVDDLLQKLGINAKRNVLPDKLSGGQKRRVCLGLALIGNASTIFLDEPTSGMDPETRRGTWDIILKYRKQKTIIITTHSMEEADVLGDRIAIMHSGKMKCYGSPMFLKKLYGHNYHDLILSTTPECDVMKISGIVGNEAKINMEHHGRMVINIPFTTSLPQILDKLYAQKADLGITGLSVSKITLEQVFLKAAEEEQNNEPVNNVHESELLDRVNEYLTGSELTRQRINGLLMKEVAYLRTNKILFVIMIILGLVSIIIPAILENVINSDGTTTLLLLSLGLYNSPEALIISENQTIGQIYKTLIENQGGTGTILETNESLSNELLTRATQDLAYYRSRIIISGEFNASLSANGFYSGSAAFSVPITLNTLFNLVLKTVAGDEYSITASIGDLPKSLTEIVNQSLSTRFSIMASYTIFFVIFFYIVALLLKHALLENSVNVKQLQRMAGVPPVLYWGTLFIVDYSIYIIVMLVILAGTFVIDSIANTSVMDATEVGIFLLIFLLFGINIILLIYVCSFIKKPFYTVYTLLGSLPLIPAFICLLLNEILPSLENAKTANLILRRILSLEPHVSFLFAYIKFLEVAADNSRCRGFSTALTQAACTISDKCCDMKWSDGYCENPDPYFSNFPQTGGLEEFVIYLAATPFILLVILGLLEQQVFGKLMSKFSMYKPTSQFQDRVVDSEVETEKNIIREAINQRASNPDCKDGNVFLAFELRKNYGRLAAVKEVSFRVKENECFGLLGVNGAGKSTTFRMLVGEEVSTGGVLHRDFYSMKSSRMKYLEGMGYCPQNDALIPYLNAVDHLTLFARLRGVPDSKIKSEVDLWINKLQLNKYAKHPSGTYSGGNKRRLNIAMALIASPKMILLDEPTTGVDPAARRWVWTVLQNCQEAGQAIILTSHSMEECEALCNRLVIMVEGRLLCVGASQELKERFGAGFNLTIKINTERSNEDFMNIKSRIQTTFVCELKDEHSGYLFYHISDSRTTWTKMFGTMDDLKSEFRCIEDFTVSTSTLEQLFIQFARSAVNPSVRPQVLYPATAQINRV